MYPLNTFGQLLPNFPNLRYLYLSEVDLTNAFLLALAEHSTDNQSADLSLTLNDCHVLWDARDAMNSSRPKIKVSEFAMYDKGGAVVSVCEWLRFFLDCENSKAIYVNVRDNPSALELVEMVSESAQMSQCLELINYGTQESSWDWINMNLNRCIALRRLRLAGDLPPNTYRFSGSEGPQFKLLAYDGPIELLSLVSNSYETLRHHHKYNLPMHRIQFFRANVYEMSLALLKDICDSFVSLKALQISANYFSLESNDTEEVSDILLEFLKSLMESLPSWKLPPNLKFLGIEGDFSDDFEDNLIQLGLKPLQHHGLIVRLSHKRTDDLGMDEVEIEVWLDELTSDEKARCLGQYYLQVLPPILD
ncbi:hypothetical protein C0995_003457 [Termitomyces sp. Mi166|nr:hypothetical protein C0995_003457 [Termitomyces sp. Mi166\